MKTVWLANNIPGMECFLNSRKKRRATDKTGKRVRLVHHISEEALSLRMTVHTGRLFTLFTVHLERGKRTSKSFHDHHFLKNSL